MSKVTTRSQRRTPQGGMNQDDSLITPSKDSAGRNAFELDDYRYALNGRIGSSRSDNFGDFENIKDTAQVTAFNKNSGLFSNSDFQGSLAPWQQIDVNTGAWIWSFLGAASNGPGNQDILYQPILATLSSRVVNVRYRYTTPVFNTTNFIVRLVFLNGTTVLSTQDVDNRSGIEGQFFDETIQVTLPNTCDGVGIQIEGTLVGVSIFLLYNFQVYGSQTHVVTGTEKVIGRYENREFQRLYYAVWNSEGNHALRYYDKANDSVYELIRWSGFNWTETTFVSMAMLDNWLAMTDRTNRPRLINVNTIADLFVNLGSNFREFHIAFHKWAPNNPPVPRVYYDGTTNNFETLKNKNYQFSMRYLYKYNLKSRWSPISKGAITTYCGNFYSGGAPRLITSIEVDIAGSLLDDPGASVQYNYFDHTDQKFIQAVDGIELAYREGGDQIWKKWKTVPMSGYSRYQYFDGNANQTPVAVEDFIQPFDTVPFLAGVVEAIDNRFVFGDCLDEQDPARVAVTDVGFVTDPAQDWNDSFVASFPQFVSPIGDDLRRLNALSDFTFKYRAVIKLGIVFHDRNGWRSATYTDDSMTYIISLLTLAASYRLIGLTLKLPSGLKPPEWAVGYQIVRTNTLNINSFMYGLANRFVPLIDSSLDNAKILATSTDIKNKINEHFENSKLVTGEMNTRVEDIDFSLELNDYLSDNSISQAIIPEIRVVDFAILMSDASRLFIEINNWYNAAQETATKNHPLNKLFYNYRPGDRVRFLGSTVTNPANLSQCKIYDLPIIEFTGSGIIVERPADLLWVSQLSVEHPLNDFNIEVYTPQKPSDLDHVFYEMGEWYPVLYPGTIQRAFSKTDWLYTNNAAVTKSTYGPFNIYNKIPIYYGDVFDPNKTIYRSNTLGGGNYIGAVHASMSPDPETTFDLWNNNRNTGRPSVSYKNTPVANFKPTQLRFGGKVVEQSFINNLNRFRDEDQFIYPSEYGRVRMLTNTSNAQVESVGSILLAIGERESWSIYVNRTTLEDLSGRSQVSLSDKVLGSYNTLLGSLGTMNPESVSVSTGRVYWWDANRGSWVRYGRDGLTEISAYKMRNWFRELGALLYSTYITDTPAVVLSEFDLFNEELVTFISHSSLPSTFRDYATYKGSTFSEDDRRWKTVHSYTPEMMGKLGTQLFLFKGGQIYKSEQGPGYSTFFGVKYDVQWEPVFNDEKELKKVWQALSQITTDKWSVERILSEYRGLKTKQQSTIPLANLEEKEDNYYAPIRGDLNTPVSNPIVEGDRMRSKAIQVLMQLDPSVTTLSLLHYVVAECVDSPKNP